MVDLKKTRAQYDAVLRERCRKLFADKAADYGSAWRVLRPASLTDQILIKVNRIRTIETTGENLVGDDIQSELVGVVNYCLMALVQCQMGVADQADLSTEKALELYDRHADDTRQLMLRKDHDYGEAWRAMRPTSITDIMLMKLLRLKQIEDNNGRTAVSEGVEGSYADICNYAIFELILLTQDTSLQ